MNKIFIILLMVFIGSACTKENFIDTGKASGIFDGNILEYMKNDPYNWDSTVVVIEWAGLTSLFEGKDAQYPEITFFGPTRLSILRYMLNNGIERIKDVEPEVWKEMMLRYVIPGKHMKDSFAVGDIDVGAATLHIQSIDTGYSIVMIASADIEPDNGAVHSLVYGFTFGKF